MTLFTPSNFFKKAWMCGTNSREGLSESVRRICHELLTRVQDPRCASADRHPIETAGTPLTLINRPGNHIDPFSWE